MRLKYLIPIKGIGWAIEECLDSQTLTLIFWYNTALICAVICGAVKLIL